GPSQGTSLRVKQEEKNPPIYESLWKKHDEKLLLQGAIDFGECPFGDKEGFHRQVEGSISFEASTNEIIEKLKRLKMKYLDNKRKGVESFKKAHDEFCFLASNHLWGPGGIYAKEKKNKTSKAKKKNEPSKGKKKNETSKVKKKEEVVKEEEEEDKKVGWVLAEDWFEKSYVVGSIAGSGIDEEAVKAGWRMAPMEEKKKIEEEWRALQLKELSFLSLKMEFLLEVTKMLK
ncbi:hypothetical protein EUTSA_v10028218mg, partial [Eutrema salsugineum]